MIAGIERLTAALGGNYRIERELGSGGMAIVYLAHDVRHDRKVAVKVLHAELAALIGAERFLSEIKTIAHLQHPHILGLIDSGTADGIPYYVMPYVQGESLRDRLNREKQLPIDDALRIAREVADALGHAHGHFVVHRDIKPENILLQGDHAFVADFGIALAVSTAGGQRLTQTGLSLGTPEYMSPEQAMGDKALDARTDVYALGAVLYEMLAGEAPFTGPSAQAIVAKVLTDTPRPLSHTRRTVPSHVETAVLTALEKLPADRFARVSAFAAALSPAAPRPAAKRRVTTFSPAVLVGAAAVLVGVAVGGFVLGGRVLGSGAGPPISFGNALQVTYEPGLEIHPALSPDGRSVAYAAGSSVSTRIFVRSVAGGRAIPLTSDTADVQTNPTWSRDGSRILFLARGSVFSAPAAGGPARQELPGGRGNLVDWAAWSPNDTTLAYAVGDSLFVRDQQSRSRLVAAFLEPSLCAWSATGRLIACTSGNRASTRVGQNFGNLSPSRIIVVGVRDGTLSTTTDTTSLNQSPTWSPDGSWLYFVSDREGPRDIYGQRVSRNGAAIGNAVRLSVGLDAQSISLSEDARHLAYAKFAATANVWSQPLPVDGPVSTERATPVTFGNQIVEMVSASRDGRWLFYSSDLTGNADLYRIALPNGEPERLTSDPSDDFAAELSPDGRELAFHSWRAGSRDIYVMPLDGGPVQQVTASAAQEWVARWSPDGSTLAFSEVSAFGSIWLARRNDGTWGKPVQRLPYGHFPVWSPDGRRLAFNNGTFPLGGSIEVIPVDSGASQRILDAMRPGNPAANLMHWSEDGRSILFKSHDLQGTASFWSVPATGGTPRQLVRFEDPLRPSYRGEWTVGSGRIYYTVEDRRSDVWVMEVGKR